MVVEVYGAYKGFTSILDLGKKFLEVKDAAAHNQLVVDFTRQIMDAQQHEATLLERIRELEGRVMKFENWQAEKQRYELTDVGRGAMAYRLKESMSNGQPPHDICANCYEDHRKSILRRENWQPMRARVLVCHDCGSVLYLEGQPHPDHAKMRPPRKGDRR